MQETKLSEILHRGRNNFDLLRLGAAFAVIIGHAYAIAPQPPLQDPVSRVLHFDYSGSLAVKFFFFLSGLLVTDSIIRRPAPLQFLIRRAFRIFPGLLACLLISVLVIGPVFTNLPIGDYFSHRDTWSYLLNNSVLHPKWTLPGVFSMNEQSVNGSLWTLPYECYCYLYLAIFCSLGGFSFRFAANAICTAVIALSFLAPECEPRFAQSTQSFLLPACFALGALFANNKQLIRIDLQHAALLWIFMWLVRNPMAHQCLFYIAVFYTAIYIASLDFVINRIKLPFDASYGVYVYGFVIQQSVHATWPSAGVYFNQSLSLALALLIGIVSWYLIEKPSITFGTRITRGN